MTTSTGYVLVLNSGSSSVKYQVIDTSQEAPLAVGLVERVTDHEVAIHEVIDTLNADPAVDMTRVTVVGHRVVQGGADFTEPVLVTDAVQERISELSALAPLHNPGHVAGMKAARALFPNLPHVAVFDTAFHSTMPAEAYTYAIDRDMAAAHAIRKYGFHGTSHQYVSRELANRLGRDNADVNSIVLHLGNGASVCAVEGGRSVDTSMGLTPLQGLVMGTRSGDIDPAVLVHLQRTAGFTVDDIDALLNRKSGMLGLTGMTDMRDVESAAEEGDENAQLALDIYARRIRGYVGQYFAQLGRLDAIAFTAGIGENSDIVRALSMTGLENLGIVLDTEANAGRKKVATKVSAADSAVEIWVIPTNEEREIALQSLVAAGL